MGQQVRCCVFTLNNYTENDMIQLNEWDYKYLIYGKEIGKTNKTPHLQGYIEFNNRKYFSTLKAFNPNIHWEKRLGSQLQAINYCKKEGNYVEYGDKKVQGKRNDISYYKELALKEGMKKVVEEGNFQEIRTCELYLKYKEEERNFKPEVIWIHGESGSGKSLKASEEKDAYWKDKSQWWDGYDKHNTIIMDDFRSSDMKFDYLLRLLDRYPMRVQVKGSSRQMLSKKIIITSIYSPEEIYSHYAQYNNNREPINQLLRRIDKTMKLEQVRSRGNTIPDSNDGYEHIRTLLQSSFQDPFDSEIVDLQKEQ